MIELVFHLLRLAVGLRCTKLSMVVVISGNHDVIGIKICSISLEMLLRSCQTRLALIRRVAAYKLVLLARLLSRSVEVERVELVLNKSALSRHMRCRGLGLGLEVQNVRVVM